MNIYLVKRTDKWSYDDYDAFVCLAENEEQARWTWPAEYYFWKDEKLYFQYSNGDIKEQKADYKHSGWTMDPKTLDVSLIGTSAEISPKVILASYNAG